MSRLVPYPLLTAGLILMWLLLNRFSLGHLLLGTAVAIVAGKSMSALQPAKPRIRRWDLIPRLFAGGGPRHRALEPRRGDADPDRRAARAAAVGLRRDPARAARPDGARHPRLHHHRHAGHRLDASTTPARDAVLLHVFDLVEEDGLDPLIKGRYESLLLEIFE